MNPRNAEEEMIEENENLREENAKLKEELAEMKRCLKSVEESRFNSFKTNADLEEKNEGLDRALRNSLVDNDDDLGIDEIELNKRVKHYLKEARGK